MQRARVANTTLLTGARVVDLSKSLLIRTGPSARQVVNVPVLANNDIQLVFGLFVS